MGLETNLSLVIITVPLHALITNHLQAAGRFYDKILKIFDVSTKEIGSFHVSSMFGTCFTSIMDIVALLSTTCFIFEAFIIKFKLCFVFSE